LSKAPRAKRTGSPLCGALRRFARFSSETHRPTWDARCTCTSSQINIALADKSTVAPRRGSFEARGIFVSYRERFEAEAGPPAAKRRDNSAATQPAISARMYNSELRGHIADV